MSEIPAGERLDRLVHEQVFGGSREDPEVPSFSTDLAASFQVVQFLAAQGYTVDMDTWVGGLAGVRLKSPIEEEQTFLGSTPAEAICRAALAIVAQR